MSDKKILHIISSSTLAALLIIFFIPFETAGRILAAVAIVAAAVLSYIFLYTYLAEPIRVGISSHEDEFDAFIPKYTLYVPSAK